MTPDGHFKAEEYWKINKKLETDNFYLDTDRGWQLLQKHGWEFQRIHKKI